MRRDMYRCILYNMSDRRDRRDRIYKTDMDISIYLYIYIYVENMRDRIDRIDRRDK